NVSASSTPSSCSRCRCPERRAGGGRVTQVSASWPVAEKSEVERFLARTDLEAYQRMELPHGLSTGGRDRSRSVEAVFAHPVAGRSVLDVGCKYGFFCHEALLR